MNDQSPMTRLAITMPINISPTSRVFEFLENDGTDLRQEQYQHNGQENDAEVHRVSDHPSLKLFTIYGTAGIEELSRDMLRETICKKMIRRG